MKKLLFVFCFGLTLSLSAKTIEEIVKEMQERNTGVKSDSAATSATTETAKEKKEKEKKSSKQENTTSGFPEFSGFNQSDFNWNNQTTDKENDKEKGKRQKKLQPFKSIEERFQEATSRSLSGATTNDSEKSSSDSLEVGSPMKETVDANGKKRVQFKPLTERFEEATKRYADYDSHAKSELASGAKVATIPKKEKPNSDHLTPIGNIAFGADCKTLRGLKSTKEPGVYQINLTSQYFVFSILKIHANGENKVSKITADKEFNSPEQAKAQYATVLTRMQSMYSITPKETESGSGKTNVFQFAGGDKITLELDTASVRPAIHATAQSATY